MADILPLLIILAVVAGLLSVCVRYTRNEEADWAAVVPLYRCNLCA
jgi:hypothetical protein